MLQRVLGDLEVVFGSCMMLSRRVKGCFRAFYHVKGIWGPFKGASKDFQRYFKAF